MRPSPTAQLNAQIRQRLAREKRLRRFHRILYGLRTVLGIATLLSVLYSLTFIPAVEDVTPKILHLEGQGATANSLDIMNDPVASQATARRACQVPRYRRAFSAKPTTARIRWTNLPNSRPVQSRVNCRTLQIG
jgi:hypothetical protein